MKKITIILAGAILACTAQAENLTTQNAISGSAFIYKVSDGDTVWLNFSDADYNKFKKLANTSNKRKNMNDHFHSIKVRIGSIDTAESVHYDSEKNTAAGKNSSKYLKSWAEKENASFRCYDYGHWGRPICAVKVGNKDIGLTMIKNGHSKYITGFGKDPYLHAEYREAMQNQ